MDKETKKKNTKIAILCIVVLIALIAGLTYAYFKARKQSDIRAGAVDFDLNFVNGPTIESKELNPIEDDKIKTEGLHKSFQMSKKESSHPTVYTKVKLDEITMTNGLKDKDMRWALYEGETLVTEGSFLNVGNGTSLDLATNIILTTTTLRNFNLYIWIQETNDAQSAGLMNGSFSAKLVVEGQIIEYESIPNEGKLDVGMIPVLYNEYSGTWYKAGGSNKWYDYNNQQWANAVTVTEENRILYLGADAGTEIPMEDINTMWVWIPRYKYKIPSNMGSSSDVATPPEIDVVFESGTSTTGVDEATYRAGITSDGTNTNYYTHPAFRDGSKIYNTTAYDIGGWDKELTGMWVGKFETSGNETSPTIKPDVLSLRSQDVSEQFLTSLKLAGGIMNTSTGVVTFNGNSTYGLTSSTNTHMMKNTEWGMVAILSQSQYGKMGNSDYEGENKEIYINNSSGYYTGRSGSSPSASATTYGGYSYNDKSCSDTKCTGSKSENSGTGASTTGTIYGIYDMNGGADEYTFGNYNGYVGYQSNNFGKYSSEFNGPLGDGTTKTDGIPFPESKYYDKYTKGTDNSTITKEKAILGDATWETMKWYQDFGGYFNNSETPFSRRGGDYNLSHKPGIFYTGSNYGFRSDYTFRLSLIH